MKLQLLVACLAAAAVAAEDDAETPCFLLGGDKANKPFPSLTQCYKQNQQACCVSAHDQTIQSAYGDVLSGTCIREYPALEQYYCLGCSPHADNFIEYYNAENMTTPDSLGDGNFREYIKYEGADVEWSADELAARTGAFHEVEGTYDDPQVSTMFKKKHGKYGEIKLCSSFAAQLLYADPTAPTAGTIDAYDGCGMMVAGPWIDDGDGIGVLSRKFFELKEESNMVGMEGVEFDETAGTNGVGAKIVEQKLDSDGTQIGADTGKLRYSPEWKFFYLMRPPYFEQDHFEISWHHTPTSPDSPDCFGAASGLQVGTMAVALVALVAQMLA